MTIVRGIGEITAMHMPVLTSRARLFTPEMVGVQIEVDGAGAQGSILRSVVAAVFSATVAQLEGECLTTCTGCSFVVGDSLYEREG